MIYFTAHTFKCVCHCRRVMFRVLGMYNFGLDIQIYEEGNPKWKISHCNCHFCFNAHAKACATPISVMGLSISIM